MVSCDLQGQIMHFLENVSPFKLLGRTTQNLQVYMSHDVDGTGQCLCYLGPKVKVK